MRNIKLLIAAVVLVFVGFFSAISIAQIQIKQIKVEKDIGSSLSNKGLLDEVMARVKKDYVDEKSEKQLNEAAAAGILSSLDPHSSYLNEEAFKDMQVQTKGEFGGLGIEITTDLSVTKVISAIEDTPAFKADVKSGDYIVKVDGKSVIGQSIEEVVKKLRGKPGTSVKITILRKGEKAPLEKTITRQIIKVKAVRSAKFNDVAYVKINSFSEQAHKGLVTELTKLKQQIGEKNLKGFVLDLRGNPGGLLDQAVQISDVFLKKDDVIVSVKGRNFEEKNFLDEQDETLVKGLPIVVLINQGSASASEIVAGALQDHKRAVIMGEKSFGKGSVQTVIPLERDRGAIKMTTALYYTPSGKSIQAKGIEPDIEVAPAKIEKLKNNERDSEADLQGHIEIQIKQLADEDKKEKKVEDNLEIYDQDYQLARAIDLVRGISSYKNTNK